MKKLSETLLFLLIADCCFHLDTMLRGNFFDKVRILNLCYLPYTSAIAVFSALALFVTFSIRINFSYDRIDIERLLQYFDKYQLHNNLIYCGKQLAGSFINDSTIYGNVSLYLKIKLLRYINTDLFPPRFFLLLSMLLTPCIYFLYADVLLSALPKLEINNAWPAHILCLSLMFIVYYKCATNFFTLKISGICCILYILLTQNMFDYCFLVVFGYICVKVEDRLLKIDAIARFLHNIEEYTPHINPHR